MYYRNNAIPIVPTLRERATTYRILAPQVFISVVVRRTFVLIIEDEGGRGQKFGKLKLINVDFLI